MLVGLEGPLDQSAVCRSRGGDDDGVDTIVGQSVIDVRGDGHRRKSLIDCLAPRLRLIDHPQRVARQVIVEVPD